MQLVVSIVSVCPMRKEPSHRSEMVSQLLFGEFAEVLEKEKEFTRVRCLYDDYEGWCQNSQLEPAEKEIITRQYTSVNSYVFYDYRRISLPLSCAVYDDPRIKARSTEITFGLSDEHIWNSSLMKPDLGNLTKIAFKFMDAPYLWGGKSVYGIDCSGFVQQVFKFFGIKLKRDAYLQAEQGELVEDFSHITFGDLAFFKNEEGRITHVGMVLEENTIFHSSGRVRADVLKEDGIYNSETGERSHVMHSVRRIIR